MLASGSNRVCSFPPRDVVTTNAGRAPFNPANLQISKLPSGQLLLRRVAQPGIPPSNSYSKLEALSTTTMENGSSSEGKDPSAFLSEIIGAPVIVKLNSGVVYKGNTLSPLLANFSNSNFFLGELQSVDGYMNIALEKTEEFVNGKLRRNYGDAFVRGNNGLFHSSLPRFSRYTWSI